MQRTSTDHVIPRSQSPARTVLTFVAAALLVMNVGGALAGEENSGLEDAMLEAQVRLVLLTEFGFDSFDVEIGVDDGNVVLSGAVDKRETRELSESIVASVDGVQSVKADLELKEKSGDDTAVAGAVEEVERETQDAVLENRVKLKLMQEIGINAFGIEVEASDGTVVLSGDADAGIDLDHIEDIVSSVDGVTDVANRISWSA